MNKTKKVKRAFDPDKIPSVESVWGRTEKLQKPTSEIEIVRLFLEKVEILSDREREVIIKTIDIINNPIFITGKDMTIKI